ncbi:MAG: hypothetical protein M1814_003676 [Vezdaea aestivalis]|nr:MAG: hypothetical protein M1814_003676 [Vezdaea aestivalis]
MAALEDDDDLYGGSDLEELSAQVFKAIEDDAIQATQKARAALPSQTRQPFQPQHNSSPNTIDLTLNSQNIQAAKQNAFANVVPSDIGTVRQNNQRPPLQNAVKRHTVASEIAQRERWRVSRYSGSNSRPKTAPNNVTKAPEADEDCMEVDLTGEDAAEEDQDLNVLVQKLLQEKRALEHSLNNARSEVRSKAGEIALVREKWNQSTKENERHLRDLKASHAEETQKYKDEVEKAEKESVRVSTEHQFLQHNLDEEVEKNKSLQKTARPKPKPQPGVTTTPKKNRLAGEGDGFDDVEFIGASPLKKKQSPHHKLGTPKVGGKRKRKIVDDSTGSSALQLSQSFGNASLADKDDDFSVLNDTSNSLEHHRVENTSYKFFQMVLNHRTAPDKPRTVELFSTFHLPSQPSRSLSAIVLDEIGSVREDSQMGFPSQLCNVFISVWSRCKDENYDKPITSLVEIISFILMQDTMTVAPDVIDTLSELIQRTTETVLIPRWQQLNQSEINQQIPVTECLKLMHLMGLGCIHSDYEVRRLFKTWHIRFLLVLLNTKQPLRDVLIMLDIIGLSVLEDSFGLINEDNPSKQEEHENHVIDFLGFLLVGPAREKDGKAEYDPADLAELRIAILRLLGAICSTQYGCKVVGNHPNAVGRLVRLAGDELDRLYDFRDGGHEDSALQISLSIMLIHTLSRRVAGWDLTVRVQGILGGAHKRLITLARLNFSEGLVLDAGIPTEVIEAARELLQDSITLEEADALEAAMENRRVRSD